MIVSSPQHGEHNVYCGTFQTHKLRTLAACYLQATKERRAHSSIVNETQFIYIYIYNIVPSYCIV